MGRLGINHISGAEHFRQCFGVSRETVDRLVTYDTLLRRWQKTINLVAPATLDDVWHRHFADSAQLWAFRSQAPMAGAPDAAERWVDLGSGGGFPGLVLAIMAAEHGGTHHVLVESDSRKAAFLREVARECRVAVDILCMRIESDETRARVGEAHCITARALAPLPRLVALSAPYFASNTLGLFSKGREVAAEIEEARKTWDFDLALKPSVTDAEGHVVLLRTLRAKSSRTEFPNAKTED